VTPSRGVIVAVILAAQTLANVGPLGIPAIASLIRADLGLTLTQAGSFLSIYYIGPVLMSLPAGTMADRWGVARTLILGQVVIGAGLLAVSASSTYALLVVLMALAGVGYGMLNPTSTKAVMAWAPPHRRATLVGLKQVGLPFGGALGAALLPVLGLAFGWRIAVAFAAAAPLVTAGLCAVVYRDPADLPKPPRQTAARTIRDVLVTRDLWLVAAATMIFAAMQTIWMAFAVLYLQSEVGLSLLAAGRYLALAQFAGMAGRVAFGIVSDRVFDGARRAPLVMAGCLSSLCATGMAFTGPGSSALWLSALAFVFGFAGIGWNGVQHTWMAELAGPGAAGTAVGLGLAVSSAGVTLGPILFGRSVELVGHYRGPWLGLAVTMIAALGLLALVRDSRRGAFI
jgi:predicted MFS family arabinose efflux permease